MPAIIAHPQPTVDILSPSKLAASSGRIQWQEGFEGNVLKFDGTGVAIINTAQLVRTGTYALDVPSKSSASWDITSSCKAIAINPFFSKTMLGFECYLNFSKVTNAAAGMTSFEVQLDVRDGTNQHLAGIQVVTGAAAADAILKYYDSTGTWTTLTGGASPLNAGYYYRLKFTFNPLTGKYGVIEWAQKRIDASSLSFYQTANTLMLGVLYLKNVGVDATVCHVYVDDIAITTHEKEYA